MTANGLESGIRYVGNFYCSLCVFMWILGNPCGGITSGWVLEEVPSLRDQSLALGGGINQVLLSDCFSGKVVSRVSGCGGK